MATNVRIPRAGEVIPTLEGFEVQDVTLESYPKPETMEVGYVLHLRLVTARPIRLRELVLGDLTSDGVKVDPEERVIVFED